MQILSSRLVEWSVGPYSVTVTFYKLFMTNIVEVTGYQSDDDDDDDDDDLKRLESSKCSQIISILVQNN